MVKLLHEVKTLQEIRGWVNQRDTQNAVNNIHDHWFINMRILTMMFGMLWVLLAEDVKVAEQVLSMAEEVMEDLVKNELMFNAFLPLAHPSTSYVALLQCACLSKIWTACLWNVWPHMLVQIIHIQSTSSKLMPFHSGFRMLIILWFREHFWLFQGHHL